MEKAPNRTFENHKDYRKHVLLKAVVTMLVEMIPGGIEPWGIGDIVTGIEAIWGRTLDGLVLSQDERIIYLIASLLPVIPARPILALYRFVRGKTPW